MNVVTRILPRLSFLAYFGIKTELQLSKAEFSCIIQVERIFFCDQFNPIHIFTTMADAGNHSPELAVDKIYLDESYNLYIPTGNIN